MKKNTNNNLTELVFILDSSGSMTGLESDTVGGFNSMIKKQRETDGECFVSTIFFNTRSSVIHDRVKLNKVKKLTEKDYVTTGCTALLDAVGDAIHHIGNIHKYARREDVPKHTIFVITTDGYENASRKYDYEQIKSLIEKQKKKYGWEFIFLGANIDAENVASSIGIDREFAANYRADSKGTSVAYSNIATYCCEARSGIAAPSMWKENIERDLNERK